MQNAAREQADTSANDFDILQQLNRNYVRSVERSDVRWFEENLAEDFLNINADGALVDRAGFLAQIARPSTRSNLEPRDVRIRIVGDCAIVNAQTTYKEADGQAGARRYTDVWSRQRGRWLCVSAQLTSC
jgi:ketosteroid isomerase-like protein